MRRAKPAQLPRNASGFRLCRHRLAGSCTNFCQYRLFAKIVAAMVLVLAVICTAVALGTPDGPARVRDAAIALGTFLAVMLPVIALGNRRDSA